MRADRLFSILMLLQTRRKMTAKELAEVLNVSRRTILRDIDALSTSGIPVYAQGGHGGGICLDEHYQVTLSGLKEAEVRALFVSGYASLLKDVGLEDQVENTLLQLFAALPLRHQAAAEHVRQRLHIDPVWWWQSSDPLPFWADLQKAVFEDTCVRVDYEHRDGEQVERVLQPYSLVVKAGAWYLVAYREGEFRAYRVSRFHEVTLLETRFERQRDFDLPSYWADYLQQSKMALSKYTFTLRVSASGMAFVKAYLPISSEVIELSNTGDAFTVQISLPALESAKMLIFGLGSQAEIVEPKTLRDAVLTSANDLLATLST